MKNVIFIKIKKTILSGGVHVLSILLFFLISFPVAFASPVVSDKSITDAVEDELINDAGVQADNIDVFTDDGIVTLKGRVNNILARERATVLARIVKGVRAVVNEIKVIPPVLYNFRQIKEEVEDALLLDPATESYEIDVAVRNNIVTLTGTVHSRKEKELCELVAKGVKGVMDVENKINIDWDRKRTDSEIEKEITKILEWDVFVDHRDVNVKVDKGNVILSGVVGSAAEKYLAAENSYVSGVKSVDNSKLEVSGWQRDGDLTRNKYSIKPAEEIRDAVKDALLQDPRVHLSDIVVEVIPESRMVILRGTVDNLKARETAAQDARNTAGVSSVKNRIKVRPDQKIGDNRIKDRLISAFRRDPYLTGYEIRINVVNGIVDLNGMVDTSFEKLQAHDVTSRVKGVINVDNNLIVKNFSNTYTFDPWVNDYFLYDFYWYGNMRRYPAKSDSEILNNIKKELFWSSFVDEDQVEVKVDDGIATLKGRVYSWLEYNTALKNAYEGGAIYVYNELTVR